MATIQEIIERRHLVSFRSAMHTEVHLGILPETSGWRVPSDGDCVGDDAPRECECDREDCAVCSMCQKVSVWQGPYHEEDLREVLQKGQPTTEADL